MKNINKLPILPILVLLFPLLLSACQNSEPKAGDLITVDVTKSYPKKELILQDLFDIEYIPLETRDGFITLGTVADIQEDFIIITDNGLSGDINFVNWEGRFLKKINRKGQSGEEYIDFRKVIYDEEREELYVNDFMAEKIVVYDLNGHFKRSLKHGSGAYFEWMDDFNEDYLICNAKAAVDPDESGYNVSNCGFSLISKDDGTLMKVNIPYEKYVSPTIILNGSQGKLYTSVRNNPQIPYHGEGMLLSEISSDTIYFCSGKDYSLRPFFVRTPSAGSMDTPIYLFPGVITSEYYFLQSVEKYYDPTTRTGFETKDLFFDKTKNALYEYHIENADFDSEQSFNLVNPRPSLSFFNNDTIAFITRMEAPDLIEALNDGKLRGPLKEIASGLDEEDNPVLMIAKYKK